MMAIFELIDNSDFFFFSIVGMLAAIAGME